MSPRYDEASRVDARKQTRGNVAHVAFHSGDLTGKKKVIALDVLECRDATILVRQ